MSAFDDAFAAAVSAFTNTFAERAPAVYLPGDVSIPVIVDRNVEARDDYGRIIMGITEISWPRSAHAEHGKGDRIRLAGGEVWLLNELVENDAFIRYRVIPCR
ncbi:MAG: hypothetical protein WBH20_14740 [Oceanisphaera sp.]|uniref:head-tail joining protein n=1 Tax=Oceanisphaera sp. TaxID=1929979 RepID=UPI003C75B6C1